MLECLPRKRWLLAFACCATTLLAPTTAAFAAPGDLDPSFGEKGEFAFQANPDCHSVCVARRGSGATALAVQRDGKIVLAGSAGQTTALIRIEPSGTLDSAFGHEGLVDGPPFAISHLAQRADNRLMGVGFDAFGIGAVEYTESGLPIPTPDFVLPGGQLPANARIFDIKLDSAGRILVLLAAPAGGLEVKRFLTYGVPDLSFGVGGTVHLRSAPATESSPPAVLGELRNGRIMVVAWIELSSQPTTRKLFFAQLTSRGRIDRSFGSGVTAPLPIRGRYRAPTLTIAPDGSVLLAAGENAMKPIEKEHLLLVRYTAAGRLDKSFGHGGLSDKVVFQGEYGGGRLGSIQPAAITFDTRGDAIVAGSNVIMTIDTGSAGSWFLARYTRHGLDCSFGKKGLVFGDDRGGANAVAIQPDGRIIIAGDRDREFMAARYLGGGVPRTCSGGPTRRSPRLRRPRAPGAGRAPGA